MTQLLQENQEQKQWNRRTEYSRTQSLHSSTSDFLILKSTAGKWKKNEIGETEQGQEIGDFKKTTTATVKRDVTK